MTLIYDENLDEYVQEDYEAFLEQLKLQEDEYEYLFA